MGLIYTATVTFGVFIPESNRDADPLFLIWQREGSGVPLSGHPTVTVEQYGDAMHRYYGLQVIGTAMAWGSGEDAQPPRRVPTTDDSAAVTAAAESLGIYGHEPGWHFVTDVG